MEILTGQTYKVTAVAGLINRVEYLFVKYINKVARFTYFAFASFKLSLFFSHIFMMNFSKKKQLQMN